MIDVELNDIRDRLRDGTMDPTELGFKEALAQRWFCLPYVMTGAEECEPNAPHKGCKWFEATYYIPGRIVDGS